ncbi:MAG: hypothetical protein EON58_05955 [Alphaproteobacteria bacterium]|nr:MAG: hypothetical protein EON58_05955 [Alphaproteobacteria bacterium]
MIADEQLTRIKRLQPEHQKVAGRMLMDGEVTQPEQLLELYWVARRYEGTHTFLGDWGAIRREVEARIMEGMQKAHMR